VTVRGRHGVPSSACAPTRHVLLPGLPGAWGWPSAGSPRNTRSTRGSALRAPDPVESRTASWNRRP
jgi:hypothetical protein